jgi:hypothetical protein
MDNKFYGGGKKLMGFLKRFFKGPRGMTKELEERGYHHLPATFQYHPARWLPATLTDNLASQ